ncbi:hypothetical protein CRE_06880 [Caenorhabditis remanei]|uniref:BTB domain-containing protein n=1 Tax=Caenorhabditis remanei TaxID=31234 RepID=E3MZP5_CAERE|nr:hypothetical protein CRE_06880 [Caenorhabditis remanei]
MTSCTINFKWKFDWSELKKQGVDEITGVIIVKSAEEEYRSAEKLELKLSEDDQVATNLIVSAMYFDICNYEYYLIPHHASGKRDYEEMFAPSDQNDTILVVEGKKLHVNKTFLSYHSKDFRALFSCLESKELKMDEIPIRYVSFEDFALLLRTFYSNPVFVTDATVEKLLELARRFLVSSVIKVSEHHLLNMSKLDNQKMLCLADEYRLPKLLEKCIYELNTMEKAKQMKQSKEFKKLSDETKAKIVDRFFKLAHI